MTLLKCILKSVILTSSALVCFNSYSQERSASAFMSCQEAQDSAKAAFLRGEPVYLMFGDALKRTDYDDILDSLASHYYNLSFVKTGWFPTFDCYNRVIESHLDSINGGNSFRRDLFKEALTIYENRN